MTSGAETMSAYEAKAHQSLERYWQRKADKQPLLPAKARRAIDATSERVRGAASTTGGFVDERTPEVVRNFGAAAVDRALEPTVRAVVGLLDLVTEWVQELNDHTTILEHHRANGHDVGDLTDLTRIDMEELDKFTRTLALRWRTLGAIEGTAMGALTFVPVGGSLAAISADLIVMHALSTAIATRAAHAYGIDPTTDEERHHLDRMLRKAWAVQAPKSGAVRSAYDAFEAGAGRVRWSQKFRQDHRIAQAVESLMKQTSNGKGVPIGKVVSKMPAIAVVTSAGVNSTVLASLAKTSIRYSQTIYLSRKYDLPLPPNLIKLD